MENVEWVVMMDFLFLDLSAQGRWYMGAVEKKIGFPHEFLVECELFHNLTACVNIWTKFHHGITQQPFVFGTYSYWGV